MQIQCIALAQVGLMELMKKKCKKFESIEKIYENLESADMNKKIKEKTNDKPQYVTAD